MSVTPVKLKAYLGKVKEDIIDGIVDFTVAFKALFLLELVQRGVITTASYHDDVVTIVEAVRTTAGRVLLETDSLPKPLLAGSSVMAGMVAEKCASLLDSLIEASLKGFSVAEARCKDVDDNRLLAMLHLSKIPAAEQRTQLLLIAEGYFLRAASFQPNQPQMWKKALDMAQARSKNTHEDPLEASFALTNLIRIAESKGKVKRVAELSLRLTESWLASPMLDHAIARLNIFLDPYRPALATSDEMARQSLRRCDLSLLDADGTLLYKLLALRIEEEHEISAINSIAQHQFTAAKNRGINTPLSTCKAVARGQYLIGTISNDRWESHAVNLRDEVLERLGDVSSNRLESATNLFTRYIRRLQERAQVASVGSVKTKPTCTKEQGLEAWITFGRIVLPILQYVADFMDCDKLDDSRKEAIKSFLSNTDVSRVAMIEQSGLAVIHFLWMRSGGQDDLPKRGELEFVHALLSELLDRIIRDGKDSKTHVTMASVLKEATNSDGSPRLAFECALASSSAILHLNSNKMPPQSLIDQALLLSAESEKYAACLGRYGTSFLLFVNMWSGFQNTP